MLRVDLAAEVTARLHQALAELSAEPVEAAADLEQSLADLLPIAGLLPRDVRRQLLAFRASPYAPSSALVTGLPIEGDLPPTPTDVVQRPVKRTRISDLAILTVAVLLGEPVAYRAEKDGAVVQNVYPTQSDSQAPSNESSAVQLGFHTELTFSRAVPDRALHEASPDFVLLLTLRCPQDRLASTAVIDARRACGRLEPRHLAALRQPLYQLMAPYSFTRDDDGSRPWSGPAALLYGPDDAPCLAFDSACGVRALTEAADQALAALIAACNDPELSESVQLRAGDLLVINNRRCAHSRSSFPAAFDGKDRWLQRVYVRRSIWPLPVESAASFRVLV